MTIWEILEISETNDKKLIKRAYGKKLKTLDLDKDIETFQALKEAMDTALKLSKVNTDPDELYIDRQVVRESQQTATFSLKNNQEIIETLNARDVLIEESLKTDFFQEIVNEEIPNELLTEAVPSAVEPELNSRQRFQIFFKEEAFFDNADEWKDLLESLNEATLEEFNEIKFMVQRFITNEFPCLSVSILNIIVDFFDFTDNDELIGEQTTESRLFMKNYHAITTAPNLDFCFFPIIEKTDRRKYFHLRYELFLELQKPLIDYGVVKSIYRKAEAICNQDSDLISIYFYALLLDRVQRKKVLKESEKRIKLENGKITPNSRFVLAYIHTLETKTLSEETIDALLVNENSTLLSINQYHLIAGFIFLLGKSYLNVFESWMKLSDLLFIDVEPKLSRIKWRLPVEARKRLKSRLSPVELDRKTIIKTTIGVLVIIGLFTGLMFLNDF